MITVALVMVIIIITIIVVVLTLHVEELRADPDRLRPGF